MPTAAIRNHRCRSWCRVKHLPTSFFTYCLACELIPHTLLPKPFPSKARKRQPHGQFYLMCMCACLCTYDALVCLSMFVYHAYGVSAHEYTCVHMWSSVSVHFFCFVFETEFLTGLELSSPSRLSWLTSKPPRSSYLCLPSTGLISIHYHTWIVRIKLRSSCLHGKHFPREPSPHSSVLSLPIDEKYWN